MIYNHKSGELVQDVLVECICPIVYDVMDEYHYLRRDESLSIYAPSYIAREILGRFLSEEGLEEFEEANSLWVHEDSDSYLLYNDKEEVVITIGYDGMVFVETARAKDGRILCSESALTYVYDEFSNKDVEKLSRDEYSVLVFGFDDECEDTESYDCDDECGCCADCCGCEECFAECDEIKEVGESNNVAVSEKENSDIVTTSEEQYFINGESVSKDEYEYYKKVFDDKMSEMFKKFWNDRLFNKIFNWKI